MDILPYQNVSQNRKRRRVFLALIIVAIAAAAIAIYVGRPFFLKQLRERQALQAKRRILNHVSNPTDVVLDEEEKSASDLLKLPGYKSVRAKDNSRNFVRFHCTDMNFVFGQDEAHAFYGRRSSRNGQEYLVFVFVQDEIFQTVHSVSFQGVSIPIHENSFSGDFKFPGSSDPPSLTLDLKPSDRLKIFAGLPDPNDKSAFIIRYQLAGRTGRIRGKVLEGGVVSFQHEADLTQNVGNAPQ